MAVQPPSYHRHMRTRWLRSKFVKLRDPNYAEVHLKVKWVLPTKAQIQYLMVRVRGRRGVESLRPVRPCPPGPAPACSQKAKRSTVCMQHYF